MEHNLVLWCSTYPPVLAPKGAGGCKPALTPLMKWVRHSKVFGPLLFKKNNKHSLVVIIIFF